ncbi:MAG: hypothetical protein K8F92_11640 [Hyphomicrobium sp.]|uniref:hypothetical protein n=1 Tax=Hyphomicrobium sp. TaxID=82 RepID=UPI001326FB61|nr:hypothetical protein [Hyphomicrobium sp.]KAB2941757.1 MAG: hypothetical protein F9K20_08395 [Hyphomicrobium sp.]MBZ0210291.1 hypothetical protein [Hyphomicrobium sp.]
MPDDARIRGDQYFENLDSGGAGRRKAIDESPAAEVEMVDVVTEAMRAAWEETIRQLGGAPSDPLPLWTRLATRILTAADEGECDPNRLKLIALGALEP